MNGPHPAAANATVSRILVGMADYSSGLDPATFEVTADFALDGEAAGKNLAAKSQETAPGGWEWKLAKPLRALAKGRLTVAVRDRQGNVTRLERTFSVAE